MAEQLGKIEKPEAEPFTNKRKLYLRGGTKLLVFYLVISLDQFAMRHRLLSMGGCTSGEQKHSTVLGI